MELHFFKMPVLKPLSHQREKDQKELGKTYFYPLPQIKYNPKTVEELKDLLKKRGQSTRGNKKDVLIKRLVEKDKRDFPNVLTQKVSLLEGVFLRKRVQDNFEYLMQVSEIKNVSIYQKKICECWRNHKNKTLEIISEINKHQDVLQKFHFCIQKILIENPPAKNENKFTYGKLVEYGVFNLIQKIGLQCIDLDKKQKVGSEFKNDCIIENLFFSVKTLKNYNDIILINKNSNNRKYSTKTNYLLCVIEQAKLYLFPSFLYREQDFIVDNDANITMKKYIFNYLEDKYPEYVVTLPELTQLQKEVLNECIEKNRIKEIFDKEYAF